MRRRRRRRRRRRPPRSADHHLQLISRLGGSHESEEATSDLIDLIDLNYLRVAVQVTLISGCTGTTPARLTRSACWSLVAAPGRCSRAAPTKSAACCPLPPALPAAGCRQRRRARRGGRDSREWRRLLHRASSQRRRVEAERGGSFQCLRCATVRYIFALDHPEPLLDHRTSGGLKRHMLDHQTTLTRSARPLLGRPLAWRSGKPNRSPGEKSS